MSEEEKRPEGEVSESGESTGVLENEGASTSGGEGADAPSESPAAEPALDAAEPAPVAAEPAPAAAEGETVEQAEPEKTQLVAAAVAHSDAHGGHSGHGHAGSSDHGHDDHGNGHVAPMTMLLGVLGALVILTVMTVMVTAVDLGSQWNFIVAMIIATVKAVLVMGYFMHLVYDSKFNVVVFTSSFLFVLLFLSLAVLDRQEYQPKVDEFEAMQKVQAGN